ncbi:MAG: hypothetical protein NTZ74_05440 [Chloroflexi bacterium]|nr:hypothetical protein [Chloroflexota bacterium]
MWPIDFTLSSKSPWFYTSVGVVGAVIAFLFFGEKENNPSKVSLKTFWVNIGFGLMIFIFGVAPAWFLLRQIAIGKYSERFALAALPGIAIILAFIIGRLATSSKSRNLIFSLLLLASISYQVQVGNLARKDFIEQKKIYSQLKWRIPVLLPGTAIYSPGIFSGLEAYYSYSMGINLLYDDNMSEAMKYWFFTPRFYEISDLLNDPNSSLKDAMRTTFEGQAGKMIAVYKNGSGCLLVLDPVYSALEVSPPVSSFELYGSLTNFDLIVDDQTKETVFPQAFGKISQNDWCYYFEKADLAKQEKNWDQVISLYSEATQKGLTPIKSAEFIPLITALIEKGQIDQAVSVTQEAITFSKAVTPAVCKLWQSSAIKNPIISKDQIDAAFGVGTCNP